MQRKKIFPVLFVLCFLFGITGFAHGDQTISVTGSIPPKESDFQLGITPSTNLLLEQHKTITYTITYGSHLFHPDQLIVEAQWYQGTIQGTGTPSVDVVEYITGSATNGYNDTRPVVDLVNQKIRWTIPSFPAQTTDQAVSFTLKTNDSYQGTNPVSWPVKVRLIAPSFTTANQIMNNTYTFNPLLVTPTPPTTPTLTPSPAVTPFAFSGISFRSVSFNTITLTANTTTPSTLTTHFGLSPNNLTQTLSDPARTTRHNIALLHLMPQTTYYMTVTATSPAGHSVSSEIYSFTTGQQGDSPQIDPQSVNFISSDVILYTPKPTDQTKTPAQPIIVVPQNVAYNFRFQVSKPNTVKRVEAIIRNKFVLGITSTEAEEPNTQTTDLIETQTGIFEGRLKSPSIPGSYEEFIRIYDTKGNIEEHKLADIQVSEPFRVFNVRTTQPIESAQVYFYYFNSLKQQYLPLPPQLFPVRNPSYTDLNGQIILPLPTGKYKAVITSIGYKEKTVMFTLGADAQDAYPSVSLTPEPFNLLTVGKYYFNILTDILATSKTYIQNISYSVRFFDLNAVVATAILVFLTLLAFSSRLHVPLKSFLSYFLHMSKVTAAQKKLGNQIKGRVFDKENGQGVIKAHVYLIDHNTSDILSHTQSTNTGDFLFKTLPHTDYDLQIMADGYEPITYHQSDMHAVEFQGYLLSLQKRDTTPSLLEQAGRFGEKLLSLFFESLLILSFVFELSLGFALGFDKTFLFLIFSSLNLFLWVIHMTHLRTEKHVF